MRKFGTTCMQVKFLADQIDGDSQLRAWGLERPSLIEAVLYGQSFYVECTENDPKGFDRSIAYARCGRRLRDKYVGIGGWMKDDTHGQTAIRNEDLKLRVYPCNFCSRTAHPLKSPTNLTAKGSAAESDTHSNAQLSLFDSPEVLYDIAPEIDTYRTLLLGMNFEGELPKAEISLPITFNQRRFTGLLIRVPLLIGDDPSRGFKSNTADVPFGEIDIKVGRKR